MSTVHHTRLDLPTSPRGMVREQAKKRFRLGLFDPLTGERVRWEGPVFRVGTEGERQARIAVQEFNRLTAHNPRVTLCLGAFEWQVASQGAPNHQNA